MPTLLFSAIIQGRSRMIAEEEMVSVEDREQIPRAYFIEGKSIRAIADKFGHGRRVVRQAIASADLPRYQRQQPPAAPILGPYKERIEQLLADNAKLPRKQRYTGQHIYKELCKAGYRGGEPPSATQHEPLILVCSPGVGKTHVATGLALAACRHGKSVRFYTAAALLNELIQARDEYRLGKVMSAALKLELVVLDELGFIPFRPAGAQLIFTFCASLYERVGLIVTTDLRFADWIQGLGDERLTAALLDRLTHRPHILELQAEPYRFRQRMQRGHRS